MASPEGRAGGAATAGAGAAAAAELRANTALDSRQQQQKRTELAWVCGTCEAECWPIRAESRCLCGHRLKEHAAAAAAGRACANARCSCPGFFFIVAEGAWTLRCRCKHRATEHDPRTRACGKGAACRGKDGEGGACGGFEASWVCNCDHPWTAHRQVEVERKVATLAERMAGGGGGVPAAVAAAALAAAAAEELERCMVVRRGREVAAD
ncbi:hypothetical protein Rsub_03128 [Raphidocelis subcapitata]|uniref:Protein FAM221A n=1 Tax=Raphidocelis subcapitata TaxID=307507 RepID=A0A2V0P050_9CHLO|nr:hypothetical protein Rsub_03128 [Raphidocelis subcapitata]|eukprot:GBF90557.1 hypothetical protein Rsub_03128 [Raphidocelis subcapitata]